MKLFLAIVATLILAQSCTPALGYKGAIELGNPESHARLNAELRCQDLLTAGQYDEALACFDALLKNSSTTDNWEGKASALYGLGRYKESLDCIEKIIDLSPQGSVAWLNKGIILEAMGSFEDANQCYEVAIQLDSESSLALYHKGKLLNSLGRYNESIDFLDKAVRLDPSNGEYIYERNRACEELGRSTEEETPICGVEASKVRYRSGETTTIYCAIGIPATVQLTVIKPDGTTYTYGPAYLTPGVYSVQGRANAPVGMRKVVLVASGEQTCSSICYFNVY